MSDLKNDKGFTPKEPYSWGFASPADVESWGRLHMAQRQAVASVLPSAEDMPGAQEIQGWYEGSERFDGLANMGAGFGAASDFGFVTNAELVTMTVASALNSEKYLAQLRGFTQSEIEGGTVPAAVNEDVPSAEEPSEATTVARSWAWGAIVGAVAAIWLSRRSN